MCLHRVSATTLCALVFADEGKKFVRLFLSFSHTHTHIWAHWYYSVYFVLWHFTIDINNLSYLFYCIFRLESIILFSRRRRQRRVFPRYATLFFLVSAYVLGSYIFIECFWFATVSRTRQCFSNRSYPSDLYKTLFLWLWNYFDLNCSNIVCHFLYVRCCCVAVCLLCATFTIDFYVFIYSIEQFILFCVFFFVAVDSAVERTPDSFTRCRVFLCLCMFDVISAVFPSFYRNIPQLLFCSNEYFPCWGLFPLPGVFSLWILCMTKKNRFFCSLNAVFYYIFSFNGLWFSVYVWFMSTNAQYLSSASLSVHFYNNNNNKKTKERKSYSPFAVNSSTNYFDDQLKHATHQPTMYVHLVLVQVAWHAIYCGFYSATFIELLKYQAIGCRFQLFFKTFVIRRFKV